MLSFYFVTSLILCLENVILNSILQKQLYISAVFSAISSAGKLSLQAVQTGDWTLVPGQALCLILSKSLKFFVSYTGALQVCKMGTTISSIPVKHLESCDQRHHVSVVNTSYSRVNALTLHTKRSSNSQPGNETRCSCTYFSFKARVPCKLKFNFVREYFQ